MANEKAANLVGFGLRPIIMWSDRLSRLPSGVCHGGSDGRDQPQPERAAKGPTTRHRLAYLPSTLPERPLVSWRRRAAPSLVGSVQCRGSGRPCRGRLGQRYWDWDCGQWRATGSGLGAPV